MSGSILEVNGDGAEPTEADRPRRWVGPALVAALIGVPVLILIFSNLESAAIAWAGLEWEAPRWVVLGATFVAGAVFGRVLSWAWRRRRRRLRTTTEAR